jgi:transcriptional regulator with XRE-family HTH domain
MGLEHDAITALAATITARRIERGWSLHELSRASGVPVVSVHRWLAQGHNNPCWRTVAKLARAVGLKAVKL